MLIGSEGKAEEGSRHGKDESLHVPRVHSGTVSALVHHEAYSRAVPVSKNMVCLHPCPN